MEKGGRDLMYSFYSLLFPFQVLPQPSSTGAHLTATSSLRSSLPTDWFHGALTSEIVCSHCAHGAGETSEYFQCLQVAVPRDGGEGPVELHDCIRSFFTDDVLEDHSSWRCTRCSSVAPPRKRYHVEKLPQTLMIQLKRFTSSRSASHVGASSSPGTHQQPTSQSGPGHTPRAHRQSSGATRVSSGSTVDLAKNSALVGFPFELDMRQYLKKGETGQNMKGCYTLYAVVDHYGTLGAGHYTVR